MSSTLICRFVSYRAEIWESSYMDNNREQLLDAIMKSADSRQETDGRKKLTCAEAFELARRFEIEIIEVGRICNQNNVRICKCQLGCFK